MAPSIHVYNNITCIIIIGIHNNKRRLVTPQSIPPTKANKQAQTHKLTLYNAANSWALCDCAPLVLPNISLTHSLTRCIAHTAPAPGIYL